MKAKEEFDATFNVSKEGVISTIFQAQYLLHFHSNPTSFCGANQFDIIFGKLR